METQPSLRINFDAKEVIRDPFPVYEEIRAAGRVVWNELLGVWMVPGYDEVYTAVCDPTRYSNAAYAAGGGELDVLDGAKIMINTDPPEQLPLRKVAQQAFLRSSLAKLEGTISGVADTLLDAPELRDRLVGGHDVEMMDAFCRQVPAQVIALLLGVPLADLQMFIDWSDDLAALMDSGQRDSDEWPNTLARGASSGNAMRAYLQEQIDLHRRHEHDDLINDLLVANGNGILDDRELLATCILLLIAGNETTTKLIGAGMRILGERPDDRQRVVDEPERIVGAIEEVLRYEGVTTILPRLVKQDSTLGGVEVEAGSFMLLLIGAANRDPAAFPDPTRFDIDRSPNRHLAFGHGIHHCLGNRLARLEAKIALNAFLDRIPQYGVADYSYKPVFLARGLDRLHIGQAG